MRIMQGALLSLVILILAQPLGAQALGTTPFWSGKSQLDDAAGLERSMRYRGATELPLESLAYYELGREASRSGQKEKATEYFEHAIALNTSFPEAHFALARLAFPGLGFWRPLNDGIWTTFNSFDSQHTFLVNIVVGSLIVFFLGSFVVLVFSGAQLLSRVQHVISELLTRWFPKPVAAVAGVLILAAPFLWGIGLLPAWLLLGGVLWPWMRRGQRQWLMALAGATVIVPALLWSLSPLLFHPLDPQGNPFLLSRAMSFPDNPGLLDGLDRAIAKDPENPNLYFAHGLLDKRSGRLNSSEKYFTQSLALGGPNAAIRNNLGVLSFLQGNYDDAVSYFRQAVDADKSLAAPHFNLSQAFAKKLYFDKADEELKEANRLAFSRIRSIIKHQRGGRNNTLLDELLPSSVFWKESLAGPRVMAQISPGLAIFFPGSLKLLPGICLSLFVLGLLIGRRLYKYLASFECTNCKRPVCRRCLRRIHRRPYCQTCGDALLQVQSVAYSKLVLNSRLKHTGRFNSAIQATLNLVFPGYHALRIGKVHTGALICVGFVAAAFGLVTGGVPLNPLAWVSQQPDPWWPMLPIAAMVLIQSISWATVWKMEEPEARFAPEEDEFEEDLAPMFGDRAA